MNAVDYVEHGFALVPIPKGSKGPALARWNERQNAVVSAAEAQALTGNIGIAHAYCTPTPTCVLDVDDLKEATPWLQTHGIALGDLLNADDAVQIISGRPGRAKLLYRLPDGGVPLQMRQIKVDGNVVLEFRCATSDGKTVQDVLPPSIHPDTGKPYTWGGKGNPLNPPVIPPVVLQLWKNVLNGKVPAVLRRRDLDTNASIESAGMPSSEEVPPKVVADLRSALLFMRADDREVWIKVGMALKPLGDVGRGLWLEWSSTSEKFDAAKDAKTWNTLKPDRMEYKFVFAEAQRQGWVNPQKKTDAATSSDVLNVPRPLPPELKPVPVLDPLILPVALRGWAVDASERFQCPIEYLVMPALAGAGAIVGNRIGIRPKQKDGSWIVYPAVWGGIVGPPGSLKTPAMNEALRPLLHLEEQAGSTYKLAYATYAAQKQAYDLQINQLNKAAKKGLGPLPPEPVKPVHTRYVVYDTTYQKLGEILADNPYGVLALADELSGLLQSLDAPGQEAARGFFLAGWGGTSSYSFDRIQRGTIVLPRFCLSVFGGFQPDRIKAYVRGAMNGRSTNDGLLQRFQMLVWPDLPAWQHVDRVPDHAATQQMRAAMLRLANLGNAQFPGINRSGQGVPLFRFTGPAQLLFDGWYKANERWLRNGNLDAARHSHFAKYRSLVPGLALQYHLLDAHQGHICEDCTYRALQMAVFLRKHAERIYASVLGGDYSGARALARRLLRGQLKDGFTARDLHHKGWADLSTPDAVRLAITYLIDFGWLNAVEHKTGGRPSTTYFLDLGASEALL